MNELRERRPVTETLEWPASMILRSLRYSRALGVSVDTRMRRNKEVKVMMTTWVSKACTYRKLPPRHRACLRHHGAPVHCLPRGMSLKCREYTPQHEMNRAELE